LEDQVKKTMFFKFFLKTPPTEYYIWWRWVRSTAIGRIREMQLKLLSKEYNMAALASGIALAEGETLVMEIEAELWATSSNPVARFFGAVNRAIAMIFGYRKKGFLIITDKRVVEVSTSINCYCVTTGREVKYVLPSSVKEVGYKRKATCGCFCPMYFLYYESFTQSTNVPLQGVDEAGALRATNALYAAIAHAQV
jgi:hypothetical protein